MDYVDEPMVPSRSSSSIYQSDEEFNAEEYEKGISYINIPLWNHTKLSDLTNQPTEFSKVFWKMKP